MWLEWDLYGTALLYCFRVSVGTVWLESHLEGTERRYSPLVSEKEQESFTVSLKYQTSGLKLSSWPGSPPPAAECWQLTAHCWLPARAGSAGENYLAQDHTLPEVASNRCQASRRSIRRPDQLPWPNWGKSEGCPASRFLPGVGWAPRWDYMASQQLPLPDPTSFTSPPGVDPASTDQQTCSLQISSPSQLPGNWICNMICPPNRFLFQPFPGAIFNSSLSVTPTASWSEILLGLP